MEHRRHRNFEFVTEVAVARQRVCLQVQECLVRLAVVPEEAEDMRSSDCPCLRNDADENTEFLHSEQVARLSLVHSDQSRLLFWESVLCYFVPCCLLPPAAAASNAAMQ
jgi:hypothetical protein